MAEPYATPRRFPRVKILGNVTGEVSFLQDVTLLGLSEGGARLEHAGQFALNAIYLPSPAGPREAATSEGSSHPPRGSTGDKG